MGKRISSLFLTAGAVALVVGLTAAPSLASTATTWNVSPGGSVALIQSGHFTLADVTTGHSIVCARMKGTGQFKSGSGLPGAGIGSVTALSLSQCTGPGGVTFTVSPRHLPWALNADSYDPSITSGTVTGTITGLHVALAGTGCQATVDGTSATADNGQTEFHYHNSLGKLKIRTEESTLHLYHVRGCAGMMNSRDAVTFSGAYHVNPAQTITASSS
jgi:hypothetical protein